MCVLLLLLRCVQFPLHFTAAGLSPSDNSNLFNPFFLFSIPLFRFLSTAVLTKFVPFLRNFHAALNLSQANDANEDDDGYDLVVVAVL